MKHLVYKMLIGITLAAGVASAAQKPNIVLILVDDGGYADFGFMGSKEMHTPAIDSIASEGMKFSQAYVSSSVCGPSRAGLLTGKYQHRFAFEFNLMERKRPQDVHKGIPAEELTIAEGLKTLGYETGCIGKWHVGFEGGKTPNGQGFDYFYGLLGGSRYYLPKEKAEPYRRMQENGVLMAETPYVTDTLGDKAVEFIARNRDNPFFLYLSFTAVHVPMEPPARYAAQFKGIKDPNRRKLAGMTKALDDNVAKVLGTLKELGLEKDTVVVFLNDNGGSKMNYANNAPLRGYKSSVYEGGIRVPQIIKWPGVLKPGSTFDVPVISLDLLPTFMAMGGGEISGDLDGVNLLPWLLGEKDGAPHDILFWKFWHKAVRKGDWKFIHNKEGKQLYNLSDDPGETENLRERYPERAGELEELFRKWHAQMPPSRIK